jgi:glyoxylase-like metal-dependent hydrolase (beta-lactamase superfamily II)
MSALEYRAPGISSIDSAYIRAGMDALHLVSDSGEAALIESGTCHSVPRVLAALQEADIVPEQVKWLLLTHVHLDHAGGAGALMQVLPQATLLVHPRGLRHMVDPSRLWAGTIAVYGEAFARAAYGQLLPVDEQRIQAASDGLQLALGARTLEVMDAPGHARHHVCYFDSLSRCWFTGDAFGLSYRETHQGERAFIFPATTPVQFDPAAMHATIDAMLARDPAGMYLTHYSLVTDVHRLGRDLHRLIDAFVEIAQASITLTGEEQRLHLRTALERLLRAEAREQGWALQGDHAVSLYANDLDLNAQGLQIWLQNKE